jgi:hypothetical protein
MPQQNRTWMDVLTDGQLLRDWTGLNAQLFFSIFHWFVVIALFSIGVALTPVLIGIPILLMAITSARALAALDYQAHAAVLNRPAAALHDDVDARGANFGERFGMYLGSGVTWRSLLYLFTKMFVGTFTVSMAWMLLPLIALEVLILGPLTIDLRLITVRLTHWLAVGAHEIPSLLLARVPERAAHDVKTKNDLRVSRLETVDEDDDLPAYRLTDDGEIVYKRG